MTGALIMVFYVISDNGPVKEMADTWQVTYNQEAIDSNEDLIVIQPFTSPMSCSILSKALHKPSFKSLLQIRIYVKWAILFRGHIAFKVVWNPWN